MYVSIGDNRLKEEIEFFFSWLLGPHLWHVEVPRLGFESELQLLAYAMATAMQDLSLCPTPLLTTMPDP